jgi:hypothetical protein
MAAFTTSFGYQCCCYFLINLTDIPAKYVRLHHAANDELRPVLCQEAPGSCGAEPEV